MINKNTKQTHNMNKIKSNKITLGQLYGVEQIYGCREENCKYCINR